MALRRRGKAWHIRFRPFKGCQEIGLATNATTKQEAAHTERQILTACKSGDFSFLDPSARAACLTMFHNQGWEVPSSLANDQPAPREDLTLWRACELFIKYPEIASKPNNWRYDYSIAHLVSKLGKDRPVKFITVPDLKNYQVERRKENAAAATVNREIGTLSRIFGVMIEMQLVEDNPARLVKRLSEKEGERQVYLSLQDVLLIMDRCPKWFKPMVLTAYYTGMRRGEMLELTRKQVNFSSRIITLYPKKTSQGASTKEGQWKRVPIHRELVPVLEETFKVSILTSEKVFLLQDGQSIRPLGIETFKNVWPRACEALKEDELLQEPFPRFGDLRHTWKTNARRSGMDPEIREAILGHAERGKSVIERYDRISNNDLLHAIDSMTFDHGETEIFVGSWKEDSQAEENADKKRTKPPEQKERSCASMT
ncbi:MAG: tyrosine-type recombinase/integrase [Desulfomonilaceae bacterium]